MAFDESKVRRGQPNNDGQFAQMVRSDNADVQLTAPVATLSPEDVTFGGYTPDNHSAIQDVIRAVGKTDNEADLWVAAESDTWQVRAEAGANIHATDELLDFLEKDPEPWVRARLTSRSDLSEGRAQRLSRDPSTSVRSAMADHSKDPEVLHRLSTDPEWDVRESAASSAFACTQDIERLSDDPYLMVVAGALGNEKCPAEVLDRNAGHSDPYRRRIIACNSTTGAGTLDTIASNPDAIGLETTAVVYHKNTGIDTFKKVARCKHPESRLALARKRDLPEDIYRTLLKDKSSKVRGEASASLRGLGIEP